MHSIALITRYIKICKRFSALKWTVVYVSVDATPQPGRVDSQDGDSLSSKCIAIARRLQGFSLFTPQQIPCQAANCLVCIVRERVLVSGLGRVCAVV